MAYEAGSIESTLTVDRDPWQAGLNQARREGREWAKTRWTATLDADPKALDTALRKARSDLSGFGRQKYAAQLGVTFDDGGLRVAEGRLDAAAAKRRELNLRAVLDGGAATLAELRALDQAADRLDGREIRMRAVLDGAPLVMSEAAAVDLAMDRLDGRNITMNVDLDGAAGLTAGLAGVEAARAAVDGKSIDVDTGPARRSIAGLIALYGTLATVASTAGIAAAGGLLGIGAGATAALPGIGAVALGFGGVTEAVKATTDQQQKQGQAAAKSGAQAAAAADAQANAAASLQNAERSLAQARENARDGAIQAARAVTRARQQAADSVVAAIDREQSAERTAARAWRDAARARGEINAALKTAKERMEDLAFQVAGGALAEERAVLNLQKAQEELNAARAAGVGGRELQELVLSYKEADLAVKQQAASNRRLTEEKRESDRLGVSGSKEVQAATERATDATERAREADRQVSQARAATAKARVDGEARVTEAIEAQARQKRQADASIAAAEASRASALRQVEAAQRKATEATSGGSAAVDKAREAMEKLSPAGQAFVRFLVGLEPKWRALRATAQEGLLPGVQSGIEALLRREPEINAFVGKYATAMGDLAQRTGEGLASEKWTDWFNWLGDQATPTIDRFGTITGNSLGGLAQLMKASSPLWYEMGDAIIRGTEAFERWATGAASGGSPGFNKFMDDVRTYGPVVWDTIVGLATAGYHVAESLAPAGAVALEFAQAVLSVIEAAPPGVILTVTAGIIGLAAAWKGLKVAATIGNTWSAATAGLSMIAGGAGTAAGRLRTLFTPSLLAATGPMQALGDKSSTLAQKVGASESQAAKFGDRMSKLGGSLPLIGVALVGVGIAYEALRDRSDEAARSVIDGSASMQQAIDQEAAAIGRSSAFWDVNAKTFEQTQVEARQKVIAEIEKQISQMGPLEAATARVNVAQAALSDAIKVYGDGSVEARTAQLDLTRAQEQADIVQISLRDHVDMATAAMRNQTNEALAAVDANLRKRMADEGVVDAQQRLTDTISQSGPASREAADAQTQLESAQSRAAAAALESDGKQAAYNDTVAKFIRETPGPLSETLQGLVNGMDAAGLASIGATYDIDETGRAVYRLPDGREIPITVDNAAALAGIAGAAYALQNLPAGKTVEVDIPTDEEREKLRILGFDVVSLPNGNVAVTAHDEQARGTLLAFQQFAAWQVANPQLAADPTIANQKMREFLDNAGRQTGVPMLDANPQRADATVRGKLDEFNRWSAAPSINANTKPADDQVKGWWQSVLDFFTRKPIVPNVAPPPPGANVLERQAPGNSRFATGGLVGHLAAGGPVAPWRRFPTGGRISGPGTGTSDDVPIMASNGEYVVRARSVRQPGVLPLLHTVNAMASGGMVGRYAAGGGIAAAGGAAGAVAVPSGDPGAAAAAAASTDGLTASMTGAASAAGMLDPMLAQLAATQTGVLAPAQDAVTAGQQALVSAGIDPLAAAMTGTLAPALAGYGQQVGVDAPVANAALQGAQAMTQASTTATAANTAANAAAMTGAVVGTSAAQQYEHGMIRGSQGMTMGSTTALAQNTGANTGAMTAATRGTSLAQQYEHGMIRNAQLMTGGSNDALAANTGQRSADMTSAVAGMSGQTQFHLGGLRGAQGVTNESTIGFADNWRGQLARTIPDSANPLRHVINVPIGGIVGAWNTIDQQFALGKHVNPPVANFATGGVAGVLPGYTPGRDTMTIGVGGGEAIMRPEWTRAVGRDYIDDGNAAARRGGVGGVRAFLAGASGSALQRLMGSYPLDDSASAARSNHRWAGAFAYGGVAPHVAAAGDAVTRALGPMPGGIGGRGSRGNASDHPSGFALDFMTMANMPLGDRVAGMLQAQAEPMAVKYIIWKQAINQGRGWNPMENRGSPTANHMDHVHASFEGGPMGGTWGDGPAGGAMFDFGALVRDAFSSVFGMIAEVPKLFGPSDQVARAAGVPKAGADMAIESLIAKLSSMFMGSGSAVPDVALANLITGVGKAMGFPRKGPEVALATALQESGLRNINYGDRDSLGIFQQRPSMGWGTPAQIMNPRYSAMKFYEGLRGVRGWESMPHTVAAQRVQKSAFGDAYAKWVGQAISLVNNSGIYDNGGLLPDDGLAVNRSGETEMVLSTDQGRALGRRLDVDDRLGALVGSRGVVAGGDGVAMLAVLEQMTQRMERAVASARQVVVYAAPGQSAESVAESTARREVAAQRTVRI